LVGPLERCGHDAVAPDLPVDDPRTGYEERVQPALGALEGVRGPVVVVGHSASAGYAALVAARVRASLLVYLCPWRVNPFDPPAGAPAVFREGAPLPPRRPDGATVWDREAAVELMYGRLPRETAEKLAARLRPASPPVGDYPLRGHPDLATSLVYASDDEFFEPAWERFMARELLGVAPIEIRGGHFPMLEDPEGLADLLDRLARDHVAELERDTGSG